MTYTKILATCDACRVRKVRCLKQRAADIVCINCQRRGDNCQFSHMKKRRTQSQSAWNPSSSNDDNDGRETATASNPGNVERGSSPNVSTRTSPQYSHHEMPSENAESSPLSENLEDNTPELCIDRILKGGQEASTDIQQSVFITSNGHVASSTVAFFSESKIKTMSNILGHNQLEPLIKGLDNAISSKLKGFANMTDKPPAAGSPLRKATITEEDIQHANAYVESFFQHVHPMYPFLDRQEFEETAWKPNLGEYISKNVMWQALYYAILGLGSMYHDGGSFSPGQGLSWKFFQASLNLMPELLLIRRTVETSQALIAMAIFAQMHASLPVDEIPVNEAARITISLGLGKRLKGPSSLQNRAKAFWVVYCMEKDFAFNVGRSSLINDCDVVCPLPTPADDALGELNWIRAWASFSRLTSKAYDSLFSISAALSHRHIYFKHSDSILADLEDWKETLPQRFRPGTAIKPHLFGNSVSLTLTVRIHLYYYNLQIAIARLMLHLSDGQHTVRQSQSKWMLMHAARAIIDLTNFMVIEPFTPSWMLTHMPLVATFILFDLVIHNPLHPETTTNLAYLDVASGYFARMQMTQGADRDISTPMAQLIAMARDHARNTDQQVESVAIIPTNDGTLNEGHGLNNPEEMLQVLHGDQDPGLQPPLNPPEFSNSAEPPIEPAIPDIWTESMESLVFPIDSSFLYNAGAPHSFDLQGPEFRFMDFLDVRR